MCGIAGLIHRDGATSVGKEMTAMLKSLKHRGPDSTGFAVYGTSTDNEYVMNWSQEPYRVRRLASVPVYLVVETEQTDER